MPSFILMTVFMNSKKIRFDWIKSIDDPSSIEYYKGRFEKSLLMLEKKKTTEKKSLFSAKIFFFLDALKDEVESIANRLSFPKTCLPTFVHTDFWINNLMFLHNTQGSHNEDVDELRNPLSSHQHFVKILDWQTSCTGSGIIDLASFLLTCHDIKNEQEKVFLYFETLKRFGVEHLTFQDYEQELKIAFLWNFIVTFPFLMSVFENSWGTYDQKVILYFVELLEKYSGLEELNIVRKLAGKTPLSVPLFSKVQDACDIM
jgi:thiamine kinase-like enzyme